jgi:transposase
MSYDGIDSVVGKRGQFMCRITRFVTRAERKHSSDAHYFNNLETRAVINFSFPQEKAPNEVRAILRETLGEHAPSYASVKNRVAQFKHGHFSTCDAPRPGRPKTVTTPEIIDEIHELIWEDRRISAKSIAEELDISFHVSGLGLSFMKFKLPVQSACDRTQLKSYLIIIVGVMHCNR